MLRCSKCKEWKDESGFTPAKDRTLRHYGSWCKFCTKAASRIYQKKRRDAGLCITCGQETTSTARCASCAEKYQLLYGEKQRKRSQNWNRALKLETLDTYGGALCACCGEDNIEFLHVDHVNGGGNKHRREIKSRGGLAFYAWLKEHNWPTGYRVLCANCNSAQGSYGYCPHEKKIDFFNLNIENRIVTQIGGDK